MPTYSESPGCRTPETLAGWSLIFLALPEIVWLHSLAARDAGRVEAEPAAVEVDRLTEALAIAEAA